jgi:hypothetical protein
LKLEFGNCLGFGICNLEFKEVRNHPTAF